MPRPPPELVVLRLPRRPNLLLLLLLLPREDPDWRRMLILDDRKLTLQAPSPSFVLERVLVADLRKEPFMLMLMFLLEVDDPRREDLRAGADGDLRWWLLVLLVEEDADARNMLEAVEV